MPQRIAFSLVVLAALCASKAQANVIVYATDPSQPASATPSNPTLTAGPNQDSFFDVFIKTDVNIVGMSLDVQLQGGDPNTRVTSAVVQNPVNSSNGGARWLVKNDGVVSVDGKSANANEGYTLSSANPGMNPANASTDAGFDAVAGAYRYVRVNFHTGSSLGSQSNLILHIGGNDIGTVPDTAVFLGAGDAAACHTQDFDCAGAGSALADGKIVVAPEPASITLIGLALFGLLGFVRRHR